MGDGAGGDQANDKASMPTPRCRVLEVVSPTSFYRLEVATHARASYLEALPLKALNLRHTC